MGSALLSGVLKACESVKTAWLFDAYEPAMAALTEQFPKVRATQSNLEVAKHADIILLCVKPDGIPTVAQEIAQSNKASLCISVAAGVSLAKLESHLGKHQRAIRVMPNTPALVGAGAAGFTLGTLATEEDATLTKQLLQAVGIAHQVPEHLLDAVTGLSGSGPAYIYLVIEAMADAGVLNGLPRPTAIELAAQTVLGAAKMVLETGEHPGVLKDQVTSPGGTTIRGIAALENAGLRHAIISAVNAATARSIEMGKASD
ncbi:MAG: pyrroline-5-carboxylate reductase [Verrucomicrobiales bacterium]|jgi:pyrroline-5-carboxylate reductase